MASTEATGDGEPSSPCKPKTKFDGVSDSAGVAFGVGVFVEVGVAVGVNVGVAVGSAVGSGVGEGVGVGKDKVTATGAVSEEGLCVLQVEVNLWAFKL